MRGFLLLEDRTDVAETAAGAMLLVLGRLLLWLMDGAPMDSTLEPRRAKARFPRLQIERH